MKHLSHFVKPGSKLINAKLNNGLFFVNPDKELAGVFSNQDATIKNLTLNANGKKHHVLLQPESFTTNQFP